MQDAATDGRSWERELGQTHQLLPLGPAALSQAQIPHRNPGATVFLGKKEQNQKGWQVAGKYRVNRNKRRKKSEWLSYSVTSGGVLAGGVLYELPCVNCLHHVGVGLSLIFAFNLEMTGLCPYKKYFHWFFRQSLWLLEVIITKDLSV